MTHFASAADYTSSQTGDQLRYFHAICARLREAGANAAYLHTSSTNAIGYGRVRRMAQHGARRPRAVRLRVSGARRRAPRNCWR
jgi:alanine racemase